MMLQHQGDLEIHGLEKCVRDGCLEVRGAMSLAIVVRKPRTYTTIFQKNIFTVKSMRLT